VRYASSVFELNYPMGKADHVFFVAFVDRSAGGTWT